MNIFIRSKYRKTFILSNVSVLLTQNKHTYQVHNSKANLKLKGRIYFQTWSSTSEVMLWPLGGKVHLASYNRKPGKIKMIMMEHKTLRRQMSNFGLRHHTYQPKCWGKLFGVHRKSCQITASKMFLQTSCFIYEQAQP